MRNISRKQIWYLLKNEELNYQLNHFQIQQFQKEWQSNLYMVVLLRFFTLRQHRFNQGLICKFMIIMSTKHYLCLLKITIKPSLATWQITKERSMYMNLKGIHPLPNSFTLSKKPIMALPDSNLLRKMMQILSILIRSLTTLNLNQKSPNKKQKNSFLNNIKKDLSHL